jgi:hypothetical protein
MRVTLRKQDARTDELGELSAEGNARWMSSTVSSETSMASTSSCCTGAGALMQHRPIPLAAYR